MNQMHRVALVAALMISVLVVDVESCINEKPQDDPAPINCIRG